MAGDTCERHPVLGAEWPTRLVAQEHKSPPACFSSSNFLSNALSATMSGKPAPVTWSPVASLSLSPCDGYCGNGHLLTPGVKTVCTCCRGAVCQVSTCQRSLDGSDGPEFHWKELAVLFKTSVLAATRTDVQRGC